MILGSGNILKSLLVGKSFGLDEKFLLISEEDFVVFILFRVVGRLTNHCAEERGPVLYGCIYRSNGSSFHILLVLGKKELQKSIFFPV